MLAGAHAVVEYLDGVLHVHNNTVGVMTNDPDFSWHLRNLNNFVSLSGSWPQQSFSAQTEVGAVPRSVGHGFNLVRCCLLSLSSIPLFTDAWSLARAFTEVYCVLLFLMLLLLMPGL